jgi:hypothetical protein
MSSNRQQCAPVITQSFSGLSRRCAELDGNARRAVEWRLDMSDSPENAGDPKRQVVPTPTPVQPVFEDEDDAAMHDDPFAWHRRAEEQDDEAVQADWQYFFRYGRARRDRE